jgi:histidinol-phosphate phosphatase family protein
MTAHLLRIAFSKPHAAAKTPAIFIDRDGVINCRRPGDYVLETAQFLFTPGIRTALKEISQLGLPLIVISNQAAVGKGLLPEEVLQDITAYMHRELASDGTFLTAVYYCPHRPDENCDCRKPKPELLFVAAKDFEIDLSRSVFIGDSETDVQAARAANCIPVLFPSDLSHAEPKEWAGNLPTALTATELFRVVAKCLEDAARVAPGDQDGRLSNRP